MYIHHYQGKIYKAMRKVQAVMDTPTVGMPFELSETSIGNLSLQLDGSVVACEGRDFLFHGCVYGIVEYPVKSKFLLFEQSLT